jgi:hypothetical protein
VIVKLPEFMAAGKAQSGLMPNGYGICTLPHSMLLYCLQPGRGGGTSGDSTSPLAAPPPAAARCERTKAVGARTTRTSHSMCCMASGSKVYVQCYLASL